MDDFAPFIGEIVQGLQAVGLNAETVELKQRTLTTLDTVIDKAGLEVRTPRVRALLELTLCQIKSYTEIVVKLLLSLCRFKSLC